jgi:PAS domain-containing protein
VHVEPLRDGDTIVGAGGIAIDASKRRAAERAFVESEARFRTLVEHLPEQGRALFLHGFLLDVGETT